MAAHQGHSSIVAQLCRTASVEVDAADHAGCSPLHHATALGHDAVVMELWSKSANVDLADANGWTGTAHQSAHANCILYGPSCDGIFSILGQPRAIFSAPCCGFTC